MRGHLFSAAAIVAIVAGQLMSGFYEDYANRHRHNSTNHNV